VGEDSLKASRQIGKLVAYAADSQTGRWQLARKENAGVRRRILESWISTLTSCQRPVCLLACRRLAI
jgi:hypothetical protein